MSDKLTDRLRGKYKIGPNGLHGTRDFSGWTPPICEEAAMRIEQLENTCRILVGALEVSRGQWVHSVNANQCFEAIEAFKRAGVKL